LITFGGVKEDLKQKDKMVIAMKKWALLRPRYLRGEDNDGNGLVHGFVGGGVGLVMKLRVGDNEVDPGQKESDDDIPDGPQRR